MAKTLRLNVSEMINDILEHHMDAEIKKRTARLQKEMERAKGFEPSTFTLARCGLTKELTSQNCQNPVGGIRILVRRILPNDKLLSGEKPVSALGFGATVSTQPSEPDVRSGVVRRLQKHFHFPSNKRLTCR